MGVGAYVGVSVALFALGVICIISRRNILYARPPRNARWQRVRRPPEFSSSSVVCGRVATSRSR